LHYVACSTDLLGDNSLSVTHLCQEDILPAVLAEVTCLQAVGPSNPPVATAPHLNPRKTTAPRLNHLRVTALPLAVSEVREVPLAVPLSVAVAVVPHLRATVPLRRVTEPHLPVNRLDRSADPLRDLSVVGHLDTAAASADPLPDTAAADLDRTTEAPLDLLLLRATELPLPHPAAMALPLAPNPRATTSHPPPATAPL
jgi:hypothetical protein